MGMSRKTRVPTVPTETATPEPEYLRVSLISPYPKNAYFSYCGLGPMLNINGDWWRETSEPERLERLRSGMKAICEGQSGPDIYIEWPDPRPPGAQEKLEKVSATIPEIVSRLKHHTVILVRLPESDK